VLNGELTVWMPKVLVGAQGTTRRPAMPGESPVRRCEVAPVMMTLMPRAGVTALPWGRTLCARRDMAQLMCLGPVTC
jgi:hypothetical protein